MPIEHPVIIDTGPLVAFLSRRDQNHAWAAEQFRRLPAVLLTCEPVLSEAHFLLSKSSIGTGTFFNLIESGLLASDFDLFSDTSAVIRLARKYRDVPMSIADACLVRMAEMHPNAVVFTTDGDFRIYRKSNRQRIPVIMPDAV